MGNRRGQRRCPYGALRDDADAGKRLSHLRSDASLFYPPVAPAVATLSRELYRDGPGLTAASMDDFWQAYAGNQPYSVLSRLDLRQWPNLAALPPCVILTAEHDVLRDEGEAFAGLLNCHGVRVHYRRAGGMIHGFARMFTGSEAARQHVDWACNQLLAF